MYAKKMWFLDAQRGEAHASDEWEKVGRRWTRIELDVEGDRARKLAE